MQFQDFYEQSASIESLQRDFQSRQFVHAYLFIGAEGVGKRSLARLCAQTLYCARKEANPCGMCGGCQRFAHGNHPDVFRVQPEKSIGVEAIRRMIADIQLRAFDDGYKVVMVEQAEKMTPQAQNCLLRTLEEPPPNTVFFLLSGARNAILPTLRSRCRIVTLAPLCVESLQNRLQSMGMAHERAVVVAPLAQGSVGRALAMEQDEGYWPLRTRVLRMLFEQAGSAALQAAAEFKEEKARSEQILEVIETAFADALRLSVAGDARPAQGYPLAWAQFASNIPQRALIRLLDCATQCKKMLAFHVSLQAALETLVINIAEENRACRW